MRAKVNLDQFEISNRFENRSVYMAVSQRATLKSQSAIKNSSVYMEISLQQLSTPSKDSIAHVQMISFN